MKPNTTLLTTKRDMNIDRDMVDNISSLSEQHSIPLSTNKVSLVSSKKKKLKYYAVRFEDGGSSIVNDVRKLKNRKDVIIKEFSHKHSAYSYLRSKSYKNRDIKSDTIAIVESKNFFICNSIKNDVLIYTDGSYSSLVYGYGAVFVYNGLIVHEIYGGTIDVIDGKSYSAEILAVEKALEYAYKQCLKYVTICYDFNGIELWSINPGDSVTAQEYKSMLDRYKGKGLSITFKWIKAHSGDRFNERADKLASIWLEKFR